MCPVEWAGPTAVRSSVRVVLSLVLGLAACLRPTVAHPPIAPEAVPSATPAAELEPTDSPSLAALLPRWSGAPGVRVRPVFFVPADAEPPAPRLETLFAAHLALAQDHFRTMLGATFVLAEGGIPVVVRGASGAAAYESAPPDSPEDRAHRITRELLEWSGHDRYSSPDLFVVLYLSAGRPIAGGGRTFNGAPGLGGGYVELDHRSLATDRPYPFQSTLVHEIGHALGLTHVDCHGRDMQRDGSIMSYDRTHHSSRLQRSATPGGLAASEHALLALAPGALPGIGPPERAVDAERVARCVFPPMHASIGPFRALTGVGYALRFDGTPVHGPEASLFTRAAAVENCDWNRRVHRGVAVACSYNGAPLP